jgi:hypothetical protein
MFRDIVDSSFDELQIGSPFKRRRADLVFIHRVESTRQARFHVLGGRCPGIARNLAVIEGQHS